MYHTIVKRIARKNFLRVNDKDYDALLKDCAPDIHHRFGGNHALGGERHDREALRHWFGRLGRLAEHLTLTVEEIWVKGLPHDTTIIIRWSATDTPPDGFDYRNHGVHIVRMKWGKVVAIDANEDSQAVAENLARLAAMGIAEAGAAPITS
jgi:ketosteroid isomerase-like protein